MLVRPLMDWRYFNNYSIIYLNICKLPTFFSWRLQDFIRCYCNISFAYWLLISIFVNLATTVRCHSELLNSFFYQGSSSPSRNRLPALGAVTLYFSHQPQSATWARLISVIEVRWKLSHLWECRRHHIFKVLARSRQEFPTITSRTIELGPMQHLKVLICSP